MKWKPPPRALLSLNCAGPFSDPPQECRRTIVVSMPFDIERLHRAARREGWFVTIVTSPGVNPPVATALCGTCADALAPELAAAAREVGKKQG